MPTETTPNIIKCWESAKFFMTNISAIWLKSDINVKQILQRIVMPAGFTIQKCNILEPLKRACFSMIFDNLKEGNQIWGQASFSFQTLKQDLQAFYRLHSVQEFQYFYTHPEAVLANFAT